MGNRTSVPAAPPKSTAELAEDEILRKGRETFDALAAANIEANIFFVVPPGTDAAEFAARFARRGALSLVDPAPLYEKTVAGLSNVEAATVASRWTDTTAAVEWLIARQALHTLHFLPVMGDVLKSVRVFARSPVEDMFITMPALLDGRIDATMSTLLNFAIETTWHTLGAHYDARNSIWVYLRIDDKYWHELCTAHRGLGTSDTQIANWNTWRAAADRFFQSSPFAMRYHTMCITIYSDVLATNVIVADVAVSIGRHILHTNDAGAWGPTVPTSTIPAFVASPDYQRNRYANAVQSMTLRAHSNPGPTPLQPSPVETKLRVTPTVADNSPFARLPAVKPYGGAAFDEF